MSPDDSFKPSPLRDLGAPGSLRVGRLDAGARLHVRMNTYAIQLKLHFQSARTDDNRFDAFVEDVKRLATVHGIAFGDFQSMQLRATDYTIGACTTCGHLTVDRANLRPDCENMLPDFWFYLRRGSLDAGTLICDLCRRAAGAR